MQIATAQEEMARAHVRGAPGVLVSGLVWLIAGWQWSSQGVVAGFYVLFFGGMMIFPLSLLLSRTLFKAPKTPKGNPLERLALESTFVLFAGTLLAYCFMRVAPHLAFPAMAVCIGVRYFIFRTVYGNPLYWALGGGVALLGALFALTSITLPLNLALLVGALEVAFSLILLMSGNGKASTA